ncbi:MAG TPA: hypothetical protein VMM80_08865 [Bacteroidota bacterium]|nr:hypothetical protein [Bacteroidota bacterium]
MSLKTFHLLFVACAVLLAFGVAAWSVDAYASGGGTAMLAAAAGACLAGAALVVYGIKVRSKLKGIGAQ